MSTSPRFEDDVIISYGHIDNEHVEDEEKGWVDAFHERLSKRLGQRLGYMPQVWRDPRLPGNVNFAYVLADRIGKARVLISILSPAYLQSPWCMGELDAFCKLAEANGGLKTGGGRFRIFKVVKTFVERDDHPPVFQGQLGYEFYEEDKAGRPVEFGQGLGKNSDQRYWTKLDELAFDIKKTLEELSPPRTTAAPARLIPDAAASKGAVYLAVSTGDLRAERDRIKFELVDRGYTVLPEGELPSTSPEFEAAVREAVGRARLSVHLIGERYGMVPEGAKGKSVVKLQNEIAAERSGESGFARVIWMPERLQPSEEEQSQFIEYLRAQSGAELLQTTLEELKSVVQARLTGSNGHRPAPAQAGGGRKVYLVCERGDREEIKPLYRSLTRRGYKVSTPLLDEGADEAARLKRHGENLRRCDAALVYYGSAEQNWVDDLMSEIENVPAAERAGPLLARGVYVAGRSNFDKEIYETNDAVLVKNFGEFSDDLLDPFVEAVEAAAKGGEDAGN